MSLALPPGPFAAYLFDIDGTIADTMPLHYRAWRETLDPLGSEYPEELFYEIGGTPTRRIVEFLNERNGLALEPLLIARRKEEAFIALLDGVRPIEAVMAVARNAVAEGRKIAAVTGSRHWVAERILAGIGASQLFSTLITADDVAQGKPAPDGYLEAARRLEVRPAECLVFEDTRIGIGAATAAGMQWVLIPRGSS